MTSQPDDAELRYDVTEAFELSALPVLSTAPGGDDLPQTGAERSTVESTYFDTPDRLLLRAGIDLRRQTGGSDGTSGADGWHLQARLPDGTRRQTRTALGRSERTVPIQLRRMVWVHTRDAALQPIATVTTQREVGLYGANGQSPVEITVERVQLCPAPDSPDSGDTVPVSWQELRVRIGADDPGLRKRVDRQLRRLGAERSAGPDTLAEQLAGSGRGGKKRGKKPGRPSGKARRGPSPTSSAGDVVVGYLTQELDRLRTEDVAVRFQVPDSIHQMRVATRRLRSAFKTFDVLFEPDSLDTLETELKWLAEDLGQARDAEVLRARLLEAVGREQVRAGTPRTVAQAVDRETRREQQAAFRVVVEALNSDRYRQLVASLESLVASPPLTARAGRPAHKVLRRLVASAYDKAKTAIARAGDLPEGDERHTQLHVARKAAKRARYACEAVTPAFGSSASDFGVAMERLQDSLGEYHDSVVMQARLRAMAEDSTPAAAFALGRLHALQDARQKAAEADVAAAASAADKKSLRGWLS